MRHFIEGMCGFGSPLHGTE